MSTYFSLLLFVLAARQWAQVIYRKRRLSHLRVQWRDTAFLNGHHRKLRQVAIFLCIRLAGEAFEQ